MAIKYEFKLIALECLEVTNFNPNEMTKSQIAHLRKTILERGFMQPLTVTPKQGAENMYIVIDGAHRLDIYKELKRSSIPCYVIPDKTLLDIKIDLINLNKIKGEFNQDKYNMLLESIMTEVDIKQMKEILNIEKAELKSFENFLNEKNKIDLDPDSIEVGSYERAKNKTKIKTADIYKLGKHRLMCGDATNELDVTKLMAGATVDLLLTDPPYGLDYASKNKFLNNLDKGNRVQEPIKNDSQSYEDMKELWVASFSNACDVMKSGASYYINAMQGGDLLLLLSSLKAAELELKQSLIWVKNNHVLGRSDYNYKHEIILYGWKGSGHKFYSSFDVSVWNIDKPLKNELHPTMKPIELCSKAILNSSLHENIVLDLFGGSGTTLIACEQLNRVCCMMEIDPVYCQIIIDRWQDYTGNEAVKITEKSENESASYIKRGVNQ